MEINNICEEKVISRGYFLTLEGIEHSKKVGEITAGKEGMESPYNPAY